MRNRRYTGIQVDKYKSPCVPVYLYACLLPTMIEIDGSLGEGGGQVLRSALSLAALTGQAFHLTNLRARRKQPGLAPQHLTSVRAAAAVCRAEIRGAHERSLELWFSPRGHPTSGEYLFDVRDAAKGGSAGGVSLIFQTILLPLLSAHGTSHVVLRGGTHVPWSPSFHYLKDVFLPALRRMGVEAEVQLNAWGFYPVGGGEIEATILGRKNKEEGRKGQEEEGGNMNGLALAVERPITVKERGELLGASGLAVAANLPSHIPQRIADRARNLLKAGGISADLRPERVRSEGPGAGLFLTADYQHATAGFGSLGQKGKPSEQVAEEACRAFLDFYNYRIAAVDMHLADQLLLPCVLAPGRSEYTTSRVTQHLLTNAEVIRRFLPAKIVVEGGLEQPGLVRVN